MKVPISRRRPSRKGHERLDLINSEHDGGEITGPRRGQTSGRLKGELLAAYGEVTLAVGRRACRPAGARAGVDRLATLSSRGAAATPVRGATVARSRRSYRKP